MEEEKQEVTQQSVEEMEEVVEDVRAEQEDTVSSAKEIYPEYQIIPNPEDEVTMDDIIEAKSKDVSTILHVYARPAISCVQKV